MSARIEGALSLAQHTGEYLAFREALYADPDRFFCRITCDSRETIPLTLALFSLGEGDLERCVCYAANLGRDADTIGTMVGAITGALGGVPGIRADWVARAHQVSATDQHELALRLAGAAIEKHKRNAQAHARFEGLLS
jgi:hypothetical protein